MKRKAGLSGLSSHLTRLEKSELVAASTTVAAAIAAAVATATKTVTAAAAKNQDKDNNPAATISSKTTVTHNQVTSFFVLQHILCHPLHLCYN